MMGNIDTFKLDADAFHKATTGRMWGEGPFGYYDYSEYPGTQAPYVVRDFTPEAEHYGQPVFRSIDPDAAKGVCEQMTREYNAQAALKEILRQLRGAGYVA